MYLLLALLLSVDDAFGNRPFHRYNEENPYRFHHDQEPGLEDLHHYHHHYTPRPPVCNLQGLQAGYNNFASYYDGLYGFLPSPDPPTSTGSTWWPGPQGAAKSRCGNGGGNDAQGCAAYAQGGNMGVCRLLVTSPSMEGVECTTLIVSTRLTATGPLVATGRESKFFMAPSSCFSNAGERALSPG